VPSLPRRRSRRHAQPTATTRPARSRTARLAARGVILGALVAGVAAVGAAFSTGLLGGEEPVETAVAEPLDAAATAAPATVRLTASRSQQRDPVAPEVEVAVTVDGATRDVTTRGTTVADALASAGVALGHDDQVTPALGEGLAAGAAIVVARVTYVDGYDTTPLPFERTERRDATLAAGVREVERAGVPGKQVVYFRARLVDGAEASREETMRTVVPPVGEVVRVGTKVVVQEPPRPTATPAPRRAASAARSAGPAASTPRSAGAAAAPSAPVHVGDTRALGRSLAAARGWGGEQFVCLERLWTKESNWNPRAQNRSSGAYGIPQALPGSKMGTVAPDWRTNPATQITWGLNYIGARYGTPCAAWAHSQARNWY
jgi:hypothetical protein